MFYRFLFSCVSVIFVYSLLFYFFLSLSLSLLFFLSLCFPDIMIIKFKFAHSHTASYSTGLFGLCIFGSRCRNSTMAGVTVQRNSIYLSSFATVFIVIVLYCLNFESVFLYYYFFFQFAASLLLWFSIFCAVLMYLHL